MSSIYVTLRVARYCISSIGFSTVYLYFTVRAFLIQLLPNAYKQMTGFSTKEHNIWTYFAKPYWSTSTPIYLQSYYKIAANVLRAVDLRSSNRH